jgi:hypothetical protein
LLDVEVALDVICNAPPEIVTPEEVALNPGAVSPLYIVDVPAWKFATLCMERFEPGDEVAMPVHPSELTINLVEDALLN